MSICLALYSLLLLSPAAFTGSLTVTDFISSTVLVKKSSMWIIINLSIGFNNASFLKNLKIGFVKGLNS